MEVLRQPLEDGAVTVSRVNGTVSFPCRFMLVAAMNPCPCGYYGHPTRPCTCSDSAVSRYLGRVSGPLLDRIDLHIEVPPVSFDNLTSAQKEESSAAVKARVDAGHPAGALPEHRGRLQRADPARASAGGLLHDARRRDAAQKRL